MDTHRLGWLAFPVAPDGGQAFLGAQGDPWDTQWDMFFGLVGAVLGLLTLRRAHDRAMARLLGSDGASGRFVV